MNFFDYFDRSVEHDDTRGDSFNQQKKDKNQQNIDQSAWLDQKKWSQSNLKQDVQSAPSSQKNIDNKKSRRSNKLFLIPIIIFGISFIYNSMTEIKDVFFDKNSQMESEWVEEMDQRNDDLSEEENKVLEVINSNQIAGSFVLLEKEFLFYPNVTLSDYLIKLDNDEAEFEEYNNLLYNWVRLSSLIEQELGEGYLMVLVAPWDEAVLVISDGNIIQNKFAPME